jgi:cell division protein FtsZ
VAAKGIAEIITVAGYINVDFEDVRTVMQNGGTAIMGSAVAEGEERATKAVSQALASPLLNDNDIRGAKYILLNITSGEDEISMDEIDEITDYIQNETGYSADLIWGNGKDENLGNKICVTIIATGFGPNGLPEIDHSERNKKVVNLLDDDVKTNITQLPTDNKEEQHEGEDQEEIDEPYLKSSDKEREQFSIEFDLSPSRNSEPKEEDNEPKLIKRDDSPRDHQPFISPSNKSESGESRSNVTKLPNEDQLKKSQERINRLKALSLKLKTSSGINELENEPAYKRRSIQLDDIPHSSDDNISRYTLSEDDENKTKLRENNSFLHDNVD